MSLLKKTKSKKLNALVMASLLTFGFMSSVEAVGYRQLISYDSFPTSRPGSYDFGGNYESTIDYSREFYIQVDRSATNISGNEDSDGNAGTVTSTKIGIILLLIKLYILVEAALHLRPANYIWLIFKQKLMVALTLILVLPTLEMLKEF